PSRSPRAGSTRMASISAARSTSPSSRTARSWCPTISSARSIASGTTGSRRMRRDRTGLAIVSACAAIAVAAAQAAAAADVKAGRQKARQCQACHGLDGQAKLPDAPNLAGQNEIYLVKALKDYRSSARQNEMMSLVSRSLKDEDIADLAAYFAAIPVTIGEPPK